MRIYRFGVNGEGWVLAQLALFVLFLLTPRVGPAWPAPELFYGGGIPLALAGLALLVYSAIKLGHSLTRFPKPMPTALLVTSGAYRFVRHPIYLGVQLAALGPALLSLSPLRLLLTLALAAFFDRRRTAKKDGCWDAIRNTRVTAQV